MCRTKYIGDEATATGVVLEAFEEYARTMWGMLPHGFQMTRVADPFPGIRQAAFGVIAAPVIHEFLRQCDTRHVDLEALAIKAIRAREELGLSWPTRRAWQVQFVKDRFYATLNGSDSYAVCLLRQAADTKMVRDLPLPLPQQITLNAYESPLLRSVVKSLDDNRQGGALRTPWLQGIGTVECSAAIESKANNAGRMKYAPASVKAFKSTLLSLRAEKPSAGLQTSSPTSPRNEEPTRPPIPNIPVQKLFPPVEFADRAAAAAQWSPYSPQQSARSIQIGSLFPVTAPSVPQQRHSSTSASSGDSEPSSDLNIHSSASKGADDAPSSSQQLEAQQISSSSVPATTFRRISEPDDQDQDKLPFASREHAASTESSAAAAHGVGENPDAVLINKPGSHKRFRLRHLSSREKNRDEDVFNHPPSDPPPPAEETGDRSAPAADDPRRRLSMPSSNPPPPAEDKIDHNPGGVEDPYARLRTAMKRIGARFTGEIGPQLWEVVDARCKVRPRMKFHESINRNRFFMACNCYVDSGVPFEMTELTGTKAAKSFLSEMASSTFKAFCDICINSLPNGDVEESALVTSLRNGVVQLKTQFGVERVGSAGETPDALETAGSSNTIADKNN
eukprot:TRINITY_DN3014_c0_g1_i1.p1 TRINITY_DN3014_c0_g1~~TRINITY_DN3014_c0_g1_i1.p1  ORF type:complete len:620 (+),score=76.75 TRINITY_DN3014_c0_g1_i1:1120-2979(+)